MLSEKGSLSDTPVMKLLLTVFELGLTGILYIKREDVLKVLYFSRGKMIWAISNSEDDKLENVLISKDLTDPTTIRKIKEDSRVSESIGKLLVEKGLITLEELIDASKEQLKRIMRSVLKWRDGGFQFIKDQPPERLLSLDLNVTDFIIDYIVEEVEISEIWKEIGTLQLELIKNPDEEKLSKYNLSDRQRELLNSFDGENRLEGILSRQSGGHRESLLKIIYFFMMSELLIKKEFELSDGSLFDTSDNASQDYSATNSDEPFETYSTAEIDRSIVEIPAVRTHQLRKNDDYHLGSIDEPGEKRLNDLRRSHISQTDQPQHDPFSDLSPDNESSKKDRTNRPYNIENENLPISRQDTIHENFQFKTTGKSQRDSKSGPTKDRTPFMAELHTEDKKRKKLFNIAMVLVFLIFIFGGIILLVLPWLQNSSSTPATTQKAEKSADIYFQESTTPKEESITNPTTTPSGNDTNTANNKPIDPNTTSQEQPKKEEPKKIEQKQIEPKKEETKTLPPTGKSAKSYFQQGNYITAGDVWKRELQATGITHSILLEMDCLPESVSSAFQRTGGGENFFILNRRNGNRNCFLVMWGKYRNAKDATDGIRTVAPSFWKQKDPPEVVELSRYF